MCWKSLKGFAYAFRGVWRCIREEWHFRFHIVAAGYVLWFAPRFSLERGEWAVLALTIGAVLAAEAVNSAVERTVDRISSEEHHLSGAAKDMAAGAVLLTSIAAVGVAVCLFWQPNVWTALITDWFQSVYKPMIFAASAVASVLFIVKWGT